MSDFSRGDRVEWSWGNGTGSGAIKERFTSDVERTLKGSKVSRKASEDDPAFLIEQEDGDEVLKSGSELSRAGPGGGSGSGSSGGSSGGSGDDRTRDELYEEARKQDVDGRSKMDKAELKRAVDG